MNFNALRAQIALRGKKLGDLQRAIGISPSSMQRKMSGKSEFTRREMQAIINFLSIEDPAAIFFDSKVS